MQHASSLVHLTGIQAWLRSNLDPVFGFPRLVRFSWQTVTTLLLENGGVPMLVPADEEDAAESGGGWQRGEQTPKVMRFIALFSFLKF